MVRARVRGRGSSAFCVLLPLTLGLGLALTPRQVAARLLRLTPLRECPGVRARARVRIRPRVRGRAFCVLLPSDSAPVSGSMPRRR